MDKGVDYLYIAGNFAVLARSSKRSYLEHPHSGEIRGSAASLVSALKICDSILKYDGHRYPFGVRVSDAAVERQNARDREKGIQYA